MSIYEGKMRRLQFLWLAPIAFCFPFAIAFLVLKAADFEHSEIQTGLPLGMMVMAIALVSHLLLTSVPVVRRLNDAGRDRSFVGLLLIPVLDILLLLYLMLLPSAELTITHKINQKQTNQNE